MKKHLVLSVVFLSLFFSLGVCLISIPSVHASATHVVISQIQIGGTSANQEFVELYNPTNAGVNVNGWRLSREASSAASFSTLVSNMSGSIAPHGYLLIAHP